MNDIDVEIWMRERSRLADQGDIPLIDVRDRVNATLAGYESIRIQMDRTPLIIGFGLFAVAATIVLLLSPSFVTMTEPWISFWLI
ncbi:MAG: hypothetical protein AAFU85_15325 [Planctomycetota bacterium]